MALPQAKKRYTPTEYYALEDAAPYKSDYYDGEIFDMSGGTSIHSLITTNLLGSLWTRLRGKPCKAYESNMRLKTEATGLRTYPDASVYCEPLKFDPEDPRLTTALNPAVVFEVLSHTTEAYDRGFKAQNYRQVPTLNNYVFLAQNRPYVEVYTRQSNGGWVLRDAVGMDAHARVDAIDVALPLSEIYDGVDFSLLAPTPLSPQ